MLTGFRMFEIILYAIVNYFPYLLLALYPFTDRFRFSKVKTILILVLLTVLQISFGAVLVLSEREFAALLSVLSTVSYMAFYFLAVKEHPGKLLFVLLMVSNFANFIVMAAKSLEGIFFPEYARQTNRWTFSVMSVLIQLVFMPPVFLFFRKYLKKPALAEGAMKVWRYLWLIPLTFYLSWYYSLYFGARSSLEQALRPQNAIYSFFINLGAMVVYMMVAKLIHQTEQNMVLQMQNNQLKIQNVQYDSLKDRMEETRRARHDLRQHMTVIASLAEKKQYGKLLEYVENYRSLYSGNSQLVYCSHFALNALISYYAQLAEEKKIRYEAKIAIPQELSASDADLTVLFGNLLENAYDGCLTLPEDQRAMCLQIAVENGNALVFSISNSYDGTVKKQNGHYLSTKHRGQGIGVESARNIAERYNGTFAIDEQTDHFRVSGMLLLP